MVKENNLFGKLKRSAYLQYHQDGIIDIVIGLGTLGFSLNMLTEGQALSILSWLPIFLYVPLKNRFLVPRFGFVLFDSDQSRHVKKTGLLIGVITLGLLMIIYVVTVGDNIFPSFELYLHKYYMLILGGLASLVLFIAGIYAGLKRMYIYALLTLTIISVGIKLNVQPPYYVIVIGSIILVIGLGLLIRFLQKNPILTSENS